MKQNNLSHFILFNSEMDTENEFIYYFIQVKIDLTKRKKKLRLISLVN